ncbi:MAG: Maf family protein [Spirochaeta sp.]|jgi:septum formation protein|nr:Maf family protein [Spirochaeta sp.]
MSCTITLASASPRRVELLQQIGIAAEVAPVAVDESSVDPGTLARKGVLPEQIPYETCLRRARLKMDAARARPRTVAILCADTVVVCAGEILDKPIDRADAMRMLRRLSGTTHRVFTAVVVADPAKSRLFEDVVATEVTFADLSETEVQHYLAAEEWRDVAGAYRIQGRAGAFVTTVSGSYSAVMGLPIHTVYSMINRFSDVFV